MKALAIIMLVLLSGSTVTAGERVITVNIYNGGFSQVSETRQIKVEKGLSVATLDKIAQKIDPASINLSGENIEVRTIDFRFDIATGDRLYNKYLGQIVEFKDEDALFTGKLLNFDEDYLYIGSVNEEGQVYIYDRDDFIYVKLPELPAGLIIEPRIDALLNSLKSGNTDVNLSYLTTGIGWHTEYRLAYDGKNSADFSAWVTLSNESGVAYPDAEVVLIAGQVDREEISKGSAEQMEKGEAYRPRKSRLEPLVDYHRYKLPFNVTIGEMETKQAMMIEATTIEVEHFYKYEWSETKSEVKSLISFNNDKDKGPGMPLPTGRISIFDKKTGAFLGSGKFDGIPAGEEAEIYLGTAFDITAERKRVDHKKIGRNKNSDIFEIKLRNHKDTRVKIIVAEEIYGYWEIVAKSDDFTKEDFQNVEFEVYVEPGQEKIITYTVEYSY